MSTKWNIFTILGIVGLILFFIGVFTSGAISVIGGLLGLFLIFIYFVRLSIKLIKKIIEKLKILTTFTIEVEKGVGKEKVESSREVKITKVETVKKKPISKRQLAFRALNKIRVPDSESNSKNKPYSVKEVKWPYHHYNIFDKNGDYSHDVDEEKIINSLIKHKNNVESALTELIEEHKDILVKKEMERLKEAEKRRVVREEAEKTAHQFRPDRILNEYIRLYRRYKYTRSWVPKEHSTMVRLSTASA